LSEARAPRAASIVNPLDRFAGWRFATDRIRDLF
jgi:hypothetical protein